MADFERSTITLPADMAALVKDAVAQGDYASTSEIVREALRYWELKPQSAAARLRLCGAMWVRA